MRFCVDDGALQVNGKFMGRYDIRKVKSEPGERAPLLPEAQEVLRGALSGLPCVLLLKLGDEDMQAVRKAGVLGEDGSVSLDGRHPWLVPYEYGAIRFSGFAPSLRVCEGPEGEGLYVAAAQLKTYRPEDLVFLRYAENRCYCSVVDEAPEGTSVDLGKGLWMQAYRHAGTDYVTAMAFGQSQLDPSGRSVTIGAYDRRDTFHLNQMMRAWQKICEFRAPTSWA